MYPSSDVCRGSIPAWAGEPPSTRSPDRAVWVYPRVGGGTPGRIGTEQVSGVYPRVGGGTWETLRDFFKGSGLSPRGRGNRTVHLLSAGCRSIPAWAGEPNLGTRLWAGAKNRQQVGSIPAWAGEPSTGHPVLATRVYPRVGGGTPHGNIGYQSRSIPAWAGEPLYRHLGSIPAWAGEPH